MKTALPIKISTLLIYSAFLINFSCKSGNKKVNDLGHIITIDRINEDGKEISPKEVFKNLEFIPLETTSQSLFARITKMQIVDQYFVIFDKTLNCVVVFLKNGKFVSKIDGKDGSFKSISTIAVDCVKKNILISDANRNKLLTYSFEGRKLSERDRTFYYRNMLPIANKTIYFRTFCADDMGVELSDNVKYKNIFYTKGLDTIYKTDFPFDPNVTKYNDLLGNEENFYRSGEKYYFSYPFNYTIYQIDTAGVRSQYTLKFPAPYELPENFISDLKFKGKRLKYIFNENNNEVIWGLSNIYTDNKYLTFSIKSMKYTPYTFIYNPKTNKYIDLANVYSNEISCFMPPYEEKIIGSDGDCFFGSLSANKVMEYAKNAIVLKEVNKNKVLKNFIENSTNLSNPVLTKFKIREDANF